MQADRKPEHSMSDDYRACDCHHREIGNQKGWREPELIENSDDERDDTHDQGWCQRKQHEAEDRSGAWQSEPACTSQATTLPRGASSTKGGDQKDLRCPGHGERERIDGRGRPQAIVGEEDYKK